MVVEREVANMSASRMVSQAAPHALRLSCFVSFDTCVKLLSYTHLDWDSIDRAGVGIYTAAWRISLCHAIGWGPWHCPVSLIVQLSARGRRGVVRRWMKLAATGYIHCFFQLLVLSRPVPHEERGGADDGNTTGGGASGNASLGTS